MTSDTTNLLTGKRIAIAGGGPSGLTLARLLQLKGADVRLFELDESVESRNQGGALDLHTDSGQVAMQQAGLFDAFLAASRPEGQATKVFDKDGKVYIDLKPEDETSTRPEIDRGVLRGLLAHSLAPGTVVWGRRLKSVERTAHGMLNLVFDGAPDQEADLVFGCDGTWSRVRPLICAEKPHYSGVTFVESRISAIDATHPAISELVGHGAIMATSDNRAIIAQRNGDGNVRVYVTLRVDEDWARSSGIDFGAPAQARQTLIELYQGWAPHIIDMLRATDDIFIPRPLYTHAPHQTWVPQPDATLLGDAAHVMPPFTGKGANLAMLDSVELADALTSGRFTDIPSALRWYEKAMLARMTDAITEVLDDQDVFIAADAPRGVQALMKRRMEHRA